MCFLQQILEACLKDLECEGCEIQEFCIILSTVSPLYQQISKFKVLRQKKHSSKMLCYFSFCLVYQQLACMISCFSLVWLFTTLWAIACQTPLSLEFSRPEYWSGCHALLQGIFPSQGSNPHLFCLLHWHHSCRLGSPNDLHERSMFLAAWWIPALGWQLSLQL